MKMPQLTESNQVEQQKEGKRKDKSWWKM